MVEGKPHVGTLPYDIDTFASLCSIKVIVDSKVLDSKIVIMGYKPTSFGNELFRDVMGRTMSVWDKKTGEIHGNCKLEDADSFYVSPKTYDELTTALAEYMK